MRKRVSSGSYLEPIIGFSRAVRVGDRVVVAGTAPIGPDGQTVGDDVYTQSIRCLEIIKDALEQAGATLDHVTRTRILLTGQADFDAAARAHGEYFANVRPACTTMRVVGFVDPAWLVEFEAEAIIT